MRRNPSERRKRLIRVFNCMPSPHTTRASPLDTYIADTTLLT